jgi:hypothetical protein
MKKLWIVLFILTGCATTSAPDVAKTPEAAPPVAGSAIPAPEVVPNNPLEPKDGESREAFLQRQIDQLSVEITQLEPKVIAAGNRVDPDGEVETKRLKKQLFTLERQKASLELQLLSLP